MSLKLPKSIEVLDRVYIVKTNAKKYGAGVSDYTIVIGTKNPRDTLSNFIHEVLEVLCIEYGVRFYRWGTQDNINLRFSMNHDQFEIITADLTRILRPLIKR